ncbi:MAG: glycosyltransferase family 39 protein [Armatimonadetes bacterium]|nr:glycosyltransferase family 39 protein [Armatimonadota bacterium]
MNWKKYLLILIILASFLLLYKLGSTSLWDNDEPLYTEIAREISQNGNWLIPHWNYEMWLCHPPLSIWFTVLSAKILGWNELSARLTSALFGVGIVILTFYLGKIFYGELAGFFSGLIILISLQFFVQARLANLDIVFLFFIELACILSYLALENTGNKRMFLYFWLSCALGTLAKGPFALFLPLSLVLLYSLITKKNNQFKKIFYLWGMIIYLLIGGSWYILGYLAVGEKFFQEIFVFYTLGRIIKPILNQSGPWYYYIPSFFSWTCKKNTFQNNQDNDKRKFLLSWIIFTFLFFTLVKTKLPNYILFIYPACAVMVGKFLKDASKKEIFLPLIFFSLFTLSIILIFIFLVYSTFSGEYLSLINGLMPSGIILLIGLILLWLVYFKKPAYLIYSISIIFFIFYIFLINFSIKIDHIKPLKPLALSLKPYLPGKKLAIASNVSGSNSLVYYLESPEKISFLKTDEDKINFLSLSKLVFCIIKQNDYLWLSQKVKKPIYIAIQNKNLLVISNFKIRIQNHN